jgi:hypothetical protein
MYAKDGKEDLTYRLLHVYFSAKRAYNKGVSTTPPEETTMFKMASMPIHVRDSTPERQNLVSKKKNQNENETTSSATKRLRKKSQTELRHWRTERDTENEIFNIGNTQEIDYDNRCERDESHQYQNVFSEASQSPIRYSQVSTKDNDDTPAKDDADFPFRPRNCQKDTTKGMDSSNALTRNSESEMNDGSYDFLSDMLRSPLDSMKLSFSLSDDGEDVAHRYSPTFLGRHNISTSASVATEVSRAEILESSLAYMKKSVLTDIFNEAESEQAALFSKFILWGRQLANEPMMQKHFSIDDSTNGYTQNSMSSNRNQFDYSTSRQYDNENERNGRHDMANDNLNDKNDNHFDNGSKYKLAQEQQLANEEPDQLEMLNLDDDDSFLLPPSRSWSEADEHNSDNIDPMDI